MKRFLMFAPLAVARDPPLYFLNNQPARDL
jgi:hypothetical protein